MTSVGLFIPLHDPSGELAPIVARVLTSDRAVNAWRGFRVHLHCLKAIASARTPAATRQAFTELGFTLEEEPPGVSGAPMVQLAWGAARAGCDWLWIDADRLLHWLLAYPGELGHLPAVFGSADVVSVSRSERAFATHPDCQTLTEGPTNRLLSQLLGIERLDPFSGAAILSQSAVAAFLASGAPGDGTAYVELFLAPARQGCSFHVYSCEGLEWETPDRYEEDIAREGYASWLDHFQDAREWRRRVELQALWLAQLARHHDQMKRGSLSAISAAQ